MVLHRDFQDVLHNGQSWTPVPTRFVRRLNTPLNNNLSHQTKKTMVFSHRLLYCAVVCSHKHPTWERSSMPPPARRPKIWQNETCREGRQGGGTCRPAGAIVPLWHPKYPISKRTQYPQRQPTKKHFFHKSFSVPFFKKEHASPVLLSPPPARRIIK